MILEHAAPWLGLLGAVIVLKNLFVPPKDRGTLIWSSIFALALMLVGIFFAPRVARAAQLDHPRACLTIERRLNATDQEKEEGYFTLGAGQEALVLIAHPRNAPLLTFLRAKVGSPVRLVIDNAGGDCR